MSKTVEKLNLYLVNLNVLYRKVQNYHWNVVGKGFFTIHSKLEEFYDDLNGQIDDVAERRSEEHTSELVTVSSRMPSSA